MSKNMLQKHYGETSKSIIVLIMEVKNIQWNNFEIVPCEFRTAVNDFVEKIIKPEIFGRDLIFMLLMTLMKESGFQLINKPGQNIADFIISMRDMKSKVYKTTFLLKQFQDIPVKIIGTPIANTLLINAFAPNITHVTYSVCIPIYEYVEVSTFGIPNNVYRLSKLCATFKDCVITPVKSAIRNHFNFASSNLSGLPLNVVLDILLRLSIRDVLSLSASCKRFNGIVHDEGLWHKFCNRDYPEVKNENDRWFEIYKKLHLEKFKKINVCYVDSGHELSRTIPSTINSRWDVIL